MAGRGVFLWAMDLLSGSNCQPTGLAPPLGAESHGCQKDTHKKAAAEPCRASLSFSPTDVMTQRQDSIPSPSQTTSRPNERIIIPRNDLPLQGPLLMSPSPTRRTLSYSREASLRHLSSEVPSCSVGSRSCVTRAALPPLPPTQT